MGKGSRKRCSNGCSIHFLRRRKAARGSDCRLPHASLRNTAANFATRPNFIMVQLSALCCHAGTKMKPKILLIEDDTGTAASLQKVLQDEGYEVDIATRGDTGLTQARERNYSVVITDLRLPGLGGLEL